MTEITKIIRDFDVSAYVEGYEFRGDGGDYQPNAMEQELLIDAISGVIGSIDEAMLKALATPNRTGGVRAEPWGWTTSGNLAVLQANPHEAVTVWGEPSEEYQRTVALYASPAIPADHVVVPQVWDVEEFKVWKGLDPIKPQWHGRGFACSSWAAALELAEYLNHNDPALTLRVAPCAVLAAALSAPASPPVGDGWRVKPLEWQKHHRDDIERYSANTRIADHIITWTASGYDLYIGSWGSAGEAKHEPFVTLDEAKAAAQADYEQRIRSALIAPPTEGDGK